MKVGIICDFHLGVRNDSPVFLDYFKRSLRWLFTQLDQNKINMIIVLGDLFDRRKYLNYVTAKICREFFLEECEQRQIKTHIITGNHDVYYKNIHTVNALREIIGNRYQYIQIYDEPALLNLDGTDIQLIPWICDSNKDISYGAIKNTKADILMGHFDIKGFELHSGNISNHGDEASFFSRFDLVFSGHYHHKSSQGNIHYLGAFAEYTWSDYNDPRGFTIFDTTTRDFQFIQNPNKIFKMLSYNDVKNADIIEKINTMDFSEYKDTYVKVLCLKKENPYAFDMMLDKLYKVSPVDITVLEESLILESNEEIEIDDVQDTPKILENYISNLTLPVKNDKVIDYMKNIYSEAISTKFV